MNNTAIILGEMHEYFFFCSNPHTKEDSMTNTTVIPQQPVK